jgi:hypothetical protein
MAAAPSSALPLNALPGPVAPGSVDVLNGDTDAPLLALPCPAGGRCATGGSPAWLPLAAGRGMEGMRGSGMLAWGEGALELTTELTIEGSAPLLSVLLCRRASAGEGDGWLGYRRGLVKDKRQHSCKRVALVLWYS